MGDCSCDAVAGVGTVDMIENVVAGAILAQNVATATQITRSAKLTTFFFMLNFVLAIADCALGGISLQTARNSTLVKDNGTKIDRESLLNDDRTTWGNFILGDEPTTRTYQVDVNAAGAWTAWYVIWCVFFMPLETGLVVYISCGLSCCFSCCFKNNNRVQPVVQASTVSTQSGPEDIIGFNNCCDQCKPSKATKEFLIQCIIMLKNVCIAGLSYGVLSFALHSPGNLILFRTGLNSPLSAGVLMITSIVSYIVQFFNLRAAEIRRRTQFPGETPTRIKIRLFFYFSQFVLSGITMTGACIAFTASIGHRLVWVADDATRLISTMLAWSFVSFATVIIAFTDTGREMCLKACLTWFNPRRD